MALANAPIWYSGIHFRGVDSVVYDRAGAGFDATVVQAVFYGLRYADYSGDSCEPGILRATSSYSLIPRSCVIQGVRVRKSAEHPLVITNHRVIQVHDIDMFVSHKRATSDSVEREKLRKVNEFLEDVQHRIRDAV